YELDGVVINAIKSHHDNCSGEKRGENVIFKFRMDGLDVCHLGDLGEDCTPELIEAILPVNVLLIPVGGNYTIDGAMAKEYVDRIMPDVVIPMHYRTKGCTLDIDKVDPFLSEFDGENVEISEVDGEIELSREDIDGEMTRIVVLNRV
ncbi:MAG: MBL fold metallo-hydrolase, partial [Candidatus Coproplasma sp.]